MSEQAPSVLAEIDHRGVATVTLNRPHVNNAYNGEMVGMLLEGVRSLSSNDAVRVIVIKGRGTASTFRPAPIWPGLRPSEAAHRQKTLPYRNRRQMPFANSMPA